jgi:hypothetical protein
MKDIAYTGQILSFENGDLVIVDGRDRVLQQVITGLKILLGDWYLDYRKGIDYINGLKAYPKILKAQIKKAILEVNGVDSVRDYTFERVGEKFRVSATVLIENKEYYLNEEYSL